MSRIEVVVVGHTCIDIIPEFYSGGETLTHVLSPGKLVNIGPLLTATGGVVPNTGGALQKLGVNTALVGKGGNDVLGRVFQDLLKSRETNTEHIRISEKDATSYTIVVNIPAVDRILLHCPGANDSFGFDDIPFELVEKAKLFHFGYPPLMKRIFSDGGLELTRIYQTAKEKGTTTSLDMHRPDPDSPAGKVDWISYLQRVLPVVDIFMPSIDELVYMINRDHFDEFESKLNSGIAAGGISKDKLEEYAARLINMGAAIVAIKLGDFGLYLQVTEDMQRLGGERFGRASYHLLVDWAGAKIYSPCFEVELAGALGAGDCTIAGFLAAILHEQPPEAAVLSATGAGACNVEQPDALSGIPSWDQLQERINGDWNKSMLVLV